MLLNLCINSIQKRQSFSVVTAIFLNTPEG